MREAIILAGGFGTRLREIVSDVPKPMALIAGRPFLEILLCFLERNGFARATLSLGFMADKIKSHFGTEFQGIELRYVVEDKPLGTGGAIRLALEQCLNDYIFVFNGDTYLEVEIDSLEQLWRETGTAIIVGKEVSDTARYGRLILENGKLRGFEEKGATGHGLINAGCYLLKKNQLDSYALNTFFSFEKDYLVNAAEQSLFNLFTTTADFIDIGTPADYAKAQVQLNKK